MRDKLGSAFCKSSPFEAICIKAVNVGLGAKSAKLTKSGLLAIDDPIECQISKKIETPASLTAKVRIIANEDVSERGIVIRKFKTV